ncbi:MAG: hypothetical protein M1827_001301 [Pycnora praestabilis]|nr:MAG: hypothetical protein M1827_001301 [Pycnora praestabilis]
MEGLPVELVFHIASFLEPSDIVRLQLVSRRFFSAGRDGKLWKTLCFENSQVEAFRKRRDMIDANLTQSSRIIALQRAATNLNQSSSRSSSAGGGATTDSRKHHVTKHEKVRAMANWDPSYTREKIDWQTEYINRHGPISLSWFQQPTDGIGDGQRKRDIQGLGLFKHGAGIDTSSGTLVVAPLDDGSVCLWNMESKSRHVDGLGLRGSIHARSAPGLLSVGGPSSTVASGLLNTKANMTGTGVVECVSVDHLRQKAYFAVQSGLNEVDLRTLQLVAHQRYPFSISALSDTKYPFPLTVGTTSTLHLHDPRFSQTIRNDQPEWAERCTSGTKSFGLCNRQSYFKRLMAADRVPEHATLFQPSPLSILHIPTLGSRWDNNAEIYVAGRFSSILVYDRRCFPRLSNTIHSGARLSSLTSLPYPFVSLEMDLMHRNDLPIEAVNSAKSVLGNTIIGCGEYNGKGSLELYGLSRAPAQLDTASALTPGRAQNSTYKNRHTASKSKLLSVVNHGTRIVFADGDGMLKWVERNGTTEVRRWHINQSQRDHSRGVFAPNPALEYSSGDVARKLLPTNGNDGQHVNRDDLLLWTGERIGLLNFSHQPALAENLEQAAESTEEASKRRDERIYVQTMRTALERQADEVRFVRGLGLGIPNS